MNGFDLRAFNQQSAYNGQYVVTSKSPLSCDLQKTVGYRLIIVGSPAAHFVEQLSSETWVTSRRSCGNSRSTSFSLRTAPQPTGVNSARKCLRHRFWQDQRRKEHIEAQNGGSL
jgi:hypothetical protein